MFTSAFFLLGAHRLLQHGQTPQLNLAAREPMHQSQMIYQALVQSEHDNNKHKGQEDPKCQSEDIEPISTHAENELDQISFHTPLVGALSPGHRSQSLMCDPVSA
jgi:hypothetical protein